MPAAEPPQTTEAATVRFELAAALKAPSPRPPVGRWVLRPINSGEPVRVEIRSGQRGFVSLPRDTQWEVGLEAEGFWAPRLSLSIDAKLAGTSLPVAVWPLGAVAGELKLEDRRDKLPKVLEVAVLQPAEKREGGPPNGRSGCDLKPKDDDTMSFRCLLPATKVDLSFQPEGFAPLYLRGVEISAIKDGQVAPLVLRKGGSVAGWVRVEGGVLAPDLCLARMEPALGPPGGGPRLGQSIQSTANEKAVAPDGSFEFMALRPGVYRLRVEQAGLSPFVSGPIRVLQGIQTLLQDPVVLRAPVDLEVAIVPEADPQGQPWGFMLARKSEGHGPSFEGASNEQGIVRARGVEAATYYASIRDAVGNEYWSDPQFAVDGPLSERREVRLDLMSLSGTVQFGDEPLDAVVLFGGRYGTERVRMEATEGKFFGALPHGGRWEVEVEWGTPARTSTVTVQVETNGEHRGRVEIDLPATRAFGRVVDTEGKPAGDAVVFAQSESVGLHTVADREGAFEFLGLPEGSFTFSASLGERNERQSSARIRRDVAAEGATGPIVLSLQRSSLWKGRVQSAYGPVAGATVQFVPAPPAPDLGVTVQSDLDGRFEAQLPPQAAEAIAVVAAPGFGLRGARLPKPGGEVQLSAEQGSLTIKLPADPTSERPGTVLSVFQDDLFIPVVALVGWARQLGVPLSPNPIVLPGLAPGRYRACYATRDLALLFAGLVDPQACVGGNLPAGGVLELALGTGR